MKNFIVVTGGAGFVGSNLIQYFLNKTSKKIISIDNYSSGKKKTILLIRELNTLKVIQKKLNFSSKNTKKKLIPFFILANFQEFTKALKNLTNAMSLTL